MRFAPRILVIAIGLLAMIAPGLLQAKTTAKPPVKLGIARFSDAAKRDVEFQQYEWMQPAFREEQIEASLMPREPFYSPRVSREQLDALLRGYHAIHLITTEEHFTMLTPELKAHARMVGEALADYVKQGGGLFLNVQAVRYPGKMDEEYWNAVLEPLGMRVLHEGVFDKTRTFEHVIMYGKQPEVFWFTRNLADSGSPLLRGVKGLCLPRRSSDGTPGTLAVEYSGAWNVVVRGEKEAGSYVTPADNNVRTEEVGTYAEEPPIVASRSLGKGRIVSYPVARIYTGMNHRNPIWPEIVESRGNPKKEWPSDGMRLQLNAYRWLGEAALENPALGTHRIAPAVPIRYAESVSWDNQPFRSIRSSDSGAEEAKGIFGARSSFSDGKGTVEEYVQAAKKAGLKFIVFSDPLEKLTGEKLEALKKACAEASAAGDFYASPGVQFTDGAGIRWAIWGERLVYPSETFKPKVSNRIYPLWDGQRILARGAYMDICGQPGSGVLSFKELRANKTHPENLWWYWHYFPRVYEDNKLVEDQFGEFLYGLRDMRKVAIASYTGIDSPEKVEAAAHRYYTSLPDMESVRKALNSHFQKNVYGMPWWSNFYVSEGPRIVEWNVVNPQMEENWRYTKGGQRVRLKLEVTSDLGIVDVKVHDADLGVVRRFSGKGEKAVTREFEMVHDRTRYLTLEVTDTQGRKAFSQYWHIYSYKQGLFRCGDNLNILSAVGMQWHPDRNQFFDAARNFQNGWGFGLEGFDTSIPLLPMPEARLQDTVNLRGVGAYPMPGNAPGMTSKIMDVELSSYNMQIASMKLENLAERFNTDTRPAPALASSPIDVSENEYFRRTHRLISLEDRVDWYTAWNHRRGREGRKDYQGSFNWHEGEIEFRKDVVLQGAVPIPLVRMTCPHDVEQNWGTHFVVASSPGEVQEVLLTPGKREIVEGTIGAGGFVSQLPSLVGYQAFLAGPGTEYAYRADLPNSIVIGLGRDGQEVKAGTVFKYRFAVGAFTDTKPDAGLLQHTAQAMNLGGGSDGYPLKVEVGTLKDAGFFLTVKAKENEARFNAGPQKLIIDLPMVVEGIEDNGCVAVYTTRRPWFRFVSTVGDRAYFQEPIDDENTIWAGNLFMADHKEIRLTAVIDGQNRNRKPFLEVHNPTEKPIETTIRSPRHAPEFGGMSAKVRIPEGTSIRLNLENGTLTPQEGE